jgi:hypothetical protein
MERPGLEALGNYKIVGLTNKQYKKDVQAEPKSLLPNIELDAKIVVYQGQQVRLSPAAWAILQLSISQLDKYVIPRFKSVLARRPRGADKFPSFSSMQKRQRSDTEVVAGTSIGRHSKLRKIERLHELEYQVIDLSFLHSLPCQIMLI